MTGLFFGQDRVALEQKLARTSSSPEELRERGLIVGVGSEVVEQIGVLAEAGVERIMLQWLDLDDLDGLEALAAAVLTQLT